MPATMILGAQWGDEGKGRAVDWLASQSNIVARFGGGDNAGHTVNVGEKVFKLHLIPAGILREQVTCVMGNGMVVNPIKMLEEIDGLKKLGIDVSPSRLMLSTRAHLITPGHIGLDAAHEKARGDKAIGTTLRGIGPTYLYKMGRRGLRAGQMVDAEMFAEAFREAMNAANVEIEQIGGDPVEVDAVMQAYVDAAERLRPYLRDATRYLNEALESGAKVVVEGAQGTLLDVDHGSYPYVTSSSTTAGGALSGLGIGPTHIERVYGVAKSFCTRVGAGPMPTELDGPVADRLRGTGENFWDEFGTTTGRTRRCGWLDAVLLRYAIMVNGITDLVVTKMDILSGFDEIKIAVGYTLDGEHLDYPPGTTEELARVEPVYETVAGWQEDVSRMRTREELPQAALDYIVRIEELSGVPVKMISVGPERDQLIQLG